jgi:hypothetical protein
LYIIGNYKYLNAKTEFFLENLGIVFLINWYLDCYRDLKNRSL